MTKLTLRVLSAILCAASASAQDWVPLVDDGFGDPLTAVVTRIVHFGGYDYVGTVDPGIGLPAKLLRTSDGVHWSPATDAGFGNPDNIGILLGDVFQGMLYASTSNFAGGGELWRSADGTQWTRVIEGGFGDPFTNISLLAATAHGGKLYVSTNRFGAGAQLLRSEDGLHWNQVGADGLGDPLAYALQGPVDFHGALYVGVSSDDTARVFRSVNGAAWQPVGAPGLGSPDNTSIRPTLVFQDHLYASVGSQLGGPGQLWRTHNGVGWTPVTQDGFNNPFNDSVNALTVHDGELYVMCGNFPQGCALLRSSDGVHFTSAAPRSFGWPGNFDVTGTAVIGGELVAATFNFDSGAQLWALRDQRELGDAYCPSGPNSSGAVATLSAAGDPSLSGTGLLLDVCGCPPFADGIFFYGLSLKGTPFRGISVCVGGPVVQIPGPTLTDADGCASRYVAYDQRFAAQIFAGGSGVGYQFWFRDGAPGASGLSNALTIVHLP